MTSNNPPCVAMDAREMKLPKHECGLYLEHNAYRDYYETISQAVEALDPDDFESPESKQRCIDTGELWILHWYPKTPIGFHKVAAPTLDECLNLALKTEAEEAS